MSAPAVASFVQELRSQQLQLPHGSYLPGSLLADSSASSSNSPTGSPRWDALRGESLVGRPGGMEIAELT